MFVVIEVEELVRELLVDNFLEVDDMFVLEIVGVLVLLLQVDMFVA